jgi:hypothetical protein
MLVACERLFTGCYVRFSMMCNGHGNGQLPRKQNNEVTHSFRRACSFFVLPRPRLRGVWRFAVPSTRK